MSHLIVASDELRELVDSRLPVMAGDDELDSMDDIKRRLEALGDPDGWIKYERQVRNDCRAHSGTSSREVLHRRESGELVQLSRTWFYMEGERRSRQWARDGGLSIQVGTLVLQDTGVPLESSWAYEHGYGMRQSAFEAQSKPLLEEAAKFRLEGRIIKNPSWKQATWVVSKGGVIDWGINYDMQVDRNGVCRNYTGRGGGHAMYLVWGTTVNGELVLKNVNSHWIKGQRIWPSKWSYVNEGFYTRAVAKSPFGAYAYLPAKVAEEEFTWGTSKTLALAKKLQQGMSL